MKLEFQAIVSLLVWVLGTEPMSSARAVSAFNCGAFSSVSYMCIFLFLEIWDGFHYVTQTCHELKIPLLQTFESWDQKHVILCLMHIFNQGFIVDIQYTNSEH